MNNKTKKILFPFGFGVLLVVIAITRYYGIYFEPEFLAKNLQTPHDYIPKRTYAHELVVNLSVFLFGLNLIFLAARRYYYSKKCRKN